MVPHATANTADPPHFYPICPASHSEFSLSTLLNTFVSRENFLHHSHVDHVSPVLRVNQSQQPLLLVSHQ